LIERLPPGRLEQVFAHPSTTAERPSPYERLEFLGDSLLGFVIAEFLYERYANFSEGDLTRVRAAVVSRRTCAAVGRALALDERLAQRHPGEKLSGSDNVVAAVVEVAIAVCYLEFGLDAVTAGVVEAFAESLELAVVAPADYKTQLQEELARRSQTVGYSLVEQEGPAHERRFTCIALVNGVQVGSGRGRSKKDAEQGAAKQALAGLGLTEEADGGVRAAR
jgi:ribonuclease III